MNKLSFLAESTSLVVKELSDLEFSFQSVQKTTNKSTLTCCRHSPTGSSSWLIFWWREFGFHTVSNWVPKICCENTFSVFIFTSFYLVLKRTWVEQNLIFFMYSQIKNLNPYFLSFIYHFFEEFTHTHFFFSQMCCLQVVIQHEHFAVADNMQFVEYLSMQPIYLQILRRQCCQGWDGLDGGWIIGCTGWSKKTVTSNFFLTDPEIS